MSDPRNITFRDFEELNAYIGNMVAEFARDNMFELDKHPMDYQEHHDYIVELFNKWLLKEDA